MHAVFDKLELTMSSVPSMSVTVDRVGAGACEGTQSELNQIA